MYGKLKSTYVENGTVKDDYVVDIRKTGADGKTFFADKLDKTKLYYIAEKIPIFALTNDCLHFDKKPMSQLKGRLKMDENAKTRTICL